MFPYFRKKISIVFPFTSSSFIFYQVGARWQRNKAPVSITWHVGTSIEIRSAVNNSYTEDAKEIVTNFWRSWNARLSVAGETLSLLPQICRHRRPRPPRLRYNRQLVRTSCVRLFTSLICSRFIHYPVCMGPFSYYKRSDWVLITRPRWENP